MHKKLNSWLDFGKFGSLILFLNCLPVKIRDNFKHQLFKNEGNMRKIMILIFCVFMVVMLTVPCWSVEERFRDYYGKLIGQIVDPETGMPINEKFYITLLYKFPDRENYEFLLIPVLDYYIGESGPLHKEITNEHGKFFFALLMGDYKIIIEPVSKNSRYCEEPFQSALQFNIYKGQITRVKKNAAIGGSLKAYLYDQNGNRIDPKTTFDKYAKIFIGLDSSVLPCRSLFLDSTENTLNQITPGEYSVSVNFDYLGFLPINKGKITIKPDETANIDVFLDLNNKTGFEGYLTNSSGQPVENAEVRFSKKDIEEWEDWVTLKAITDAQGFYRIIGVPVGKYSISVSINFESAKVKDNNIIETQKGITIRKDIQFED